MKDPQGSKGLQVGVCLLASLRPVDHISGMLHGLEQLRGQPPALGGVDGGFSPGLQHGRLHELCVKPLLGIGRNLLKDGQCLCVPLFGEGQAARRGSPAVNRRQIWEPVEQHLQRPAQETADRRVTWAFAVKLGGDGRGKLDRAVRAALGRMLAGYPGEALRSLEPLAVGKQCLGHAEQRFCTGSLIQIGPREESPEQGDGLGSGIIRTGQLFGLRHRDNGGKLLQRRIRIRGQGEPGEDDLANGGGRDPQLSVKQIKVGVERTAQELLALPAGRLRGELPA